MTKFINFTKLLQHDIDTADKKIRDFGWVMFVVAGLIVPLIITWRSDWVFHGWAQGFLLFGLIILLLSLFAKPVAKPLYIGWMTLALLMATFTTKLVIGLVFYLIMTPIGLARRMLVRDPINMRIEPDKESYWKSKEGKRSPELYEKQY